jgi:endonuclease YncB( thermonuclease family)
MALARVVPFSRRPRRKRRPWRWPARLRKLPWPPLAALVGVAAVLWIAAGLHPNAMGGPGAFALSGSGALAAGVTGGFTLCARARRPDCVIDGDTIRYGGVKIRLEDIDAPEVFSPKCPSELARGNRATQRLLELINQGPFELVRTGTRDKDRYGRKLRTLERAGRSLGATLVAEGLARPWDGARHPWCS